MNEIELNRLCNKLDNAIRLDKELFKRTVIETFPAERLELLMIDFFDRYTSGIKLVADMNVRAFIEDCLVLDTASKTLTREVHNAYKEWCYNRGVFPLSNSKVKSELLKHDAIVFAKIGNHFYKGIRLK